MKKYSLLAIAIFLLSKAIVLYMAGAYTVSGLKKFALRWDGGHFINLAQNWYNGVSDYAFAPLTPLIIRLTMKITGLEAWQAALLTANIWSIGLLIALSRLYGWRIAGLAMLYPPLPLYTTAPYSEPIALTLLALGLYEAKKNRYMTAGLLIGLGATARYTIALAGLSLFLLELWRSYKRAFRLLIGLAIPGVIVVWFFASSPWGLTVYFKAETYWQAGTATPIDQAEWLLSSPIVRAFSALRGVPTPPQLYLVRNILFITLAIAGLLLAWKQRRRTEDVIVSLPGALLPPLLTGVPAMSVPRLLLASIVSPIGIAPRRWWTILLYVVASLGAAYVYTVWHMESFFG